MTDTVEDVIALPDGLEAILPEAFAGTAAYEYHIPAEFA